jgi:CRP/FNR family transcriptional regulator, anaerobic regulatory protein
MVFLEVNNPQKHLRMKLSEKISESVFFKTKPNPVLLDWLFKLVFAQKVKKGEFILHEGEVCNRLYYIESGLIRIFRTQESKEISTWFAKEGDFISTVNSFHWGVPSLESFEALEDCVIYSITKKQYHFLVEQSSSFALFAMNELFNNLCEYQNQCEFLRTLSAPERVKLIEKKYPYFLTRVKNKDLSTFLNIEQTYLSKLLNAKE